MATSLASATVRQRNGVAVIALAGDINASADATLTGAFDEALHGKPESVVLNFADVSYINSTGIALIVGLLARARKDRLEIRACGLSEHYREIFQITRLADFMPMFEDESSAVSGG